MPPVGRRSASSVIPAQKQYLTTVGFLMEAFTLALGGLSATREAVFPGSGATGRVVSGDQLSSSFYVTLLVNLSPVTLARGLPGSWSLVTLTVPIRSILMSHPRRGKHL